LDIDFARTQALQDPAWPTGDGVEGRGVGEHGEDHVDGLRDGPRATGPLQSRIEQPLRLCLRAVVPGDAMAGGQEPARDAAPHHSQSNKPEVCHCDPTLLRCPHRSSYRLTVKESTASRANTICMAAAQRLSLVHLTQPPRAPSSGPPPLLLLLHGVGSHEGDLIGLAPYLDGRFYIVSARAPIQLGPGMYGWYHVTLDPQVPV